MCTFIPNRSCNCRSKRVCGVFEVSALAGIGQQAGYRRAGHSHATADGLHRLSLYVISQRSSACQFISIDILFGKLILGWLYFL